MRRSAIFSALLLAAGGNVLRAASSAETLGRWGAARNRALADAVAAFPRDFPAASINPASAEGLSVPATMIDFHQGFAEDGFQSIAHARPVGRGVWWAGIGRYDAGDLELTLADGGTSNVSAQEDWSLAVGHARPLVANVSAGIEARWLRSVLADEAHAQTLSWNGGLLWRTPAPRLSAALALRHLGPDLTYDREGDPLPLTAEAALSWSRSWGENLRGMFALSAAVLPRDDASEWGVGGEITAHERLALRLGYRREDPSRSEQGALRYGLGFTVGRWTLDYAQTPTDGDVPEHRLSLIFR